MPNRKINIVLIPPEPWVENVKPRGVKDRPDGSAIYRLLAEEHGIEIEIIDPSWPNWMPLVRRHPLYFGLNPMRALHILIKRRKVDLVISAFESSSVWVLLLRRLFLFTPPVVMWDIAPDERWRPRKWIQRFVVPRIDKVFLLSSAQLPILEERWQAIDKGLVIGQHVDTDFYKPVKPQPDGPIFAIGDDHGRDWPTLIEAVRYLDVDLIIKTRHKLEIPADAKCRVTQISKRLTYEDLRNLYANCLFVVIPLSNTLNVSGVGSVLESMAMGKALVISDNPPIRDYFERGVTAEVVPVRDASVLRTAILKLIGNPRIRGEMASAARFRAVNLYSYPAFTHRLASAIKSSL